MLDQRSWNLSVSKVVFYVICTKTDGVTQHSLYLVAVRLAVCQRPVLLDEKFDNVLSESVPRGDRLSNCLLVAGEVDHGHMVDYVLLTVAGIYS